MVESVNNHLKQTKDYCYYPLVKYMVLEMISLYSCMMLGLAKVFTTTATSPKNPVQPRTVRTFPVWNFRPVWRRPDARLPEPRSASCCCDLSVPWSHEAELKLTELVGGMQLERKSRNEKTQTRWFKVTQLDPLSRDLIWSPRGHDSPLKGSRFHHLKKVTAWITRKLLVFLMFLVLPSPHQNKTK